MKTKNYRFIFFIPILLAGMVNVTHAQFKVGFKAGLNSNSFRPEDKVRLFASRGKVEDNIQKSQAAIYDATQVMNAGDSSAMDKTVVLRPVVAEQAPDDAATDIKL